jgi:hypothetical protein
MKMQKCPFKFELRIDISITDLNFRYTLKNQLKDVIKILSDIENSENKQGNSTVINFLENIRLRL